MRLHRQERPTINSSCSAPDASRVGLSGAMYMVLAIALLSVMDAAVKWLQLEGVHALQIIALRGLVIVPLLLILQRLQGDVRALLPVRTLPHVLRAVVGFAAPVCFFLGIASVPLSGAVLVFFSSVFMITALSVVFLGERVGPRRWATIVVGYVGVVIVIWPEARASGGGALSGYLLVLAGSAAYSVLFVSGRYLTRTESVVSLVMSFNLVASLMAALLLPWLWHPMDIAAVGWVLVVGVLALGGHYCITKAFSLAESSLIAPLEYTGLLWALAFDAVLFGVLPVPATALGAVLIIGSGLYVMYRERHVNATG